MAWLATFTPLRGARRIRSAAFPTEMSRGSLLMEIAPPGPCPRGLWLLGHRVTDGEAWWLTLDVLADDRLQLRITRGAQQLRLVLSGWAGASADPVRLTFSWDCTAGRSLLSLENPVTGTLRQAELAAALPVPGLALEGLFAAPLARRDPAVAWFAAASHVHRPGPCPGLAAQTRVATPVGPRPAAALRAGDWVTTLDNGPQPLRWSGRIEVPALGGFAPLRMAAPYFGLERDLVLAPQQRVLLSGVDVEDTLGRDEVLAEARHLADGITALPDASAATVTWHGLLLDRHELILAEGQAVESLYAGSLARHPEMAATTLLARLAATGTLPLHRRPVRPELRDYEARGLCLKRMRARGPLAA
ncbi:Hint domain-containing protein [Frigidibacter albus]